MEKQNSMKDLDINVNFMIIINSIVLKFFEKINIFFVQIVYLQIIKNVNIYNKIEKFLKDPLLIGVIGACITATGGTSTEYDGSTVNKNNM